MSIKFVWDDSLLINNAQLDRQHKAMFELANSFEEGLDEQKIKQLIKELHKYACEHFAAEENMMYASNYHGLKEHHQMHNELVAKLDDISTHTFNNDKSVFEFMTFVYDWLTHHILNKDKDYMRFVQAQQKVS